MKTTKQQIYKRQTTLAEIGETGQQKLLQTKIIVVGCGGLGSVAAVYLAASGIGTIHLVDYDVVDASNLHRQVFYKTNNIGKPKAEVLADHIKEITPFVKVSYSTTAISKSSVFDAINDSDFVLDCTDSLPIKYLLNDACVLKDKALIYGSLYKFDGYIASFNIAQENGDFSANLRDAFPEISQEAIPNCSEIGTLNTIVGIIGLMQANEVLKLVCHIGKPLIDWLLIYNSLENSQYKMKLKKVFTKAMVQQLFEQEPYFDAACEVQDTSLLITANELKELLNKGSDNLSGQENDLKAKGLCIISVIEDDTFDYPFLIQEQIPLSQLNLELIDLIPNNNYIIVCQKGITSYTATLKIKEKYPHLKVLSLQGGIQNY